VSVIITTEKGREGKRREEKGREGKVEKRWNEPERKVHRCESLADVLFQHGRVVQPLALVVVLQVRRQQVDGNVVAVVLEIL
jgi:hypothetical protein